jgi:outer membrane protein assembly factor BamB
MRTGQARWSLPVVGITSPWAAGDVVYVVGKDGLVVCAARESGQIYWTRDLNAGVKVKKASGGGRFSWMKMPGLPGKKALKPIWSGPLLANNRLIMVGSTGELVALNAKTGEIQRRIDIGAPALLSPIAAGNTIYVLTDSAQLIALR